MKHLIKKNGFTYMELLIVVAIFLILIGVITVSLAQTRNSVSLSSEIEKLLLDIKTQQMKAIVGSTEGRTTADSYGFYFEQNKYTLFHGSAYNPTDSTNVPVNLDSGMQFVNISFPSSILLFSKRSGEMTGFAVGSNTITVRSLSDSQDRTITVNRYGVITSK